MKNYQPYFTWLFFTWLYFTLFYFTSLYLYICLHLHKYFVCFVLFGIDIIVLCQWHLTIIKRTLVTIIDRHNNKNYDCNDNNVYSKNDNDHNKDELYSVPLSTTCFNLYCVVSYGRHIVHWFVFQPTFEQVSVAYADLSVVQLHLSTYGIRLNKIKK